MTDKLVSRLSALLALFFATMLPWLVYDVAFAEDIETEVGIIEYVAPNSECRIERRGLPVQPSVFAPIMNGDIIFIEHEEGQVRLEMFNQEAKRVVISKANQPYTIDEELPQPQLASGILKWAGEMYAWLQPETKADFVTNRAKSENKGHELPGGSSSSSTVANANDLTELPGYSGNSEGVFQDQAGITGGQGKVQTASSAKIRIPLLDKPQVVAAGRRRLALAWAGGSGPFSVQLFASDALSPVAKGRTTEHAWISEPVDLHPGRYRIKFKSETSATVQTVEVVDPAMLPSPAEQLDRALPDDLRATVQAAWLAAQGEGQFVLESYSELPPLRAIYHPAEVLAQALERGAVLPNTAP